VSIAETNLKLGLTTGADLLQAKALLLEVRIEVLRNEQKAKSSK
jgi:outer membrane protein TolC